MQLLIEHFKNHQNSSKMPGMEFLRQHHGYSTDLNQFFFWFAPRVYISLQFDHRVDLIRGTQ